MFKMRTIKGGIADKNGKKYSANLDTMFVSSMHIGVESMLAEKEAAEERMMRVIDNPLISRRGKVY